MFLLVGELCSASEVWGSIFGGFLGGRFTPQFSFTWWCDFFFHVIFFHGKRRRAIFDGKKSNKKPTIQNSFPIFVSKNITKKTIYVQKDDSSKTPKNPGNKKKLAPGGRFSRSWWLTKIDLTVRPKMDFLLTRFL